jgi:hypothetical protein
MFCIVISALVWALKPCRNKHGKEELKQGKATEPISGLLLFWRTQILSALKIFYTIRIPGEKPTTDSLCKSKAKQSHYTP